MIGYGTQWIVFSHLDRFYPLLDSSQLASTIDKFFHFTKDSTCSLVFGLLYAIHLEINDQRKLEV